ncbi:MAG: hypothetical protein K6T51_03600 [Rubrobacteraceae bacterium]|uniref:hypothetical protein n=1 Tax=Rubrobacter naiadicus TaxID=1392641 RepID=UPI00235DF9AA|nr:hypothetical protein [Rubrobacter naiadicus]MBX6763581.1 hypothetical protein [Rubrobacteraceae bacterium]MCL6437673.1 hypothetical protein [Rubrobacteraceae bacterium]
MNSDDLDRLARAIGGTSEEEIGCDECFEQLDRFVEMELAGLDAAEAMPLVKDHLERCGDCREEFEALLAALQAARGSSPVRSVWGRLRRIFGVG